jgi:hypothetical protein
VTVPLPALADIPGGSLPGVLRIETSDREATTPIILDMLRSVYPHEQVFGEYCTVHGYIAAPPREVYRYLSDTRSLEEWTWPSPPTTSRVIGTSGTIRPVDASNGMISMW